MVAFARQIQAAAVEGGERGAMADGDDGGARKPPLQQVIERRLGRLIERGGGFIEQEVIGRVQNRPREAEPLLLAERQYPVPMCFFVDAGGEIRQADRGDELGDLRGVVAAGLTRIGDRLGQRCDREIGALRQNHHAGAFRY